jgi:hypothetical protein
VHRESMPLTYSLLIKLHVPVKGSEVIVLAMVRLHASLAETKVAFVIDA